MKPRRPAQLDDAQIEAIEGDSDVAYNSELAHTSAQALVSMGHHHSEDDPSVRERILTLAAEEGIDVIAEAWVRSPEDTLPGALWRGYLLREWIRRYSGEVEERFEAARLVFEREGEEGYARISSTLRPEAVRELWESVFAGGFAGQLAEVLGQSARFLGFLAAIEVIWISDDDHPLATEVTRRDEALIRTAKELAVAAQLAGKDALE